MNLSAHRHLQHLRRKKRWQWASRFIVIFYTWGKKTKKRRRARDVRHHLLHLRKKTKKWWWAKEAHHHLLHLRKKIDDNEPLSFRHLLHLRRGKNKEMAMSQGGSPSSATFKKKKTDDDKPPGSSSSSTPEKKKNDDEPRGSSSSSALEEKTKRLVYSLHFSTTHFVCTKFV